MLKSQPTLHLLCGKICAGKSTLAAKLASVDGAVLIAEDDWLSALFADEMTALKDFVRCSSKLRAIMGPHITILLKSGLSVVLDFQANTTTSRAWMRSIIEQSGSDHQLHVLVPPDDVCLARLAKRNASGEHQFTVTEEQFHQFSRYFAPPMPNEGFNLVYHGTPTEFPR